MISELCLYSWHAISTAMQLCLLLQLGIQAACPSCSQRIYTFGKCSGHIVFEVKFHVMMEAKPFVQAKASAPGI